MKRFFCLLSIFLLLPVLSFSEPGVVLCYRLNQYAVSYNQDHPGAFDFDSMIIDLYLMDDFETAYFMKTLFVGGSIDTSGFVKCTVGKKENNKYPLIFPDGSNYYFYYDENSDCWLEMLGGSYRLLENERFNIRTDFKAQ